MRYPFKCDVCNTELVVNEPYESMKKKEHLVYCPCCGEKMHRVFECNFILKGSGWSFDGYTTRGDLAEMDRKADEEIELEKKARGLL